MEINISGSPNIYFTENCHGCFTGREAKPIANVSVYPNPAYDIITIRSAHAGHMSVEITSSKGQLISIQEMDGTTLQLDLSSFQKGVYFITIRSKDFLTTRKIVKLWEYIRDSSRIEHLVPECLSSAMSGTQVA